MEKKIFLALNLHYLTQTQLFLLLCLIGVAEGVVLLLYMHYKKNYYVGLPEFFWIFLCIPIIIYMLFFIEHLTFFSCVFYTQLLLVILYYMTKQYKIIDIFKPNEKEKEKDES